MHLQRDTHTNLGKPHNATEVLAVRLGRSDTTTCQLVVLRRVAEKERVRFESVVDHACSVLKGVNTGERK